MAFLEAMAMGKCVVANDDATMNEYIENGENGILFSPGKVRPVSAKSVSRVIAGVGASAARLQARWRADSEKINDFIAKQEQCKPSLLNRVKIAISYPIYLMEGARYVLSEHSSDIKSGVDIKPGVGAEPGERA